MLELHQPCFLGMDFHDLFMGENCFKITETSENEVGWVIFILCSSAKLETSQLLGGLALLLSLSPQKKFQDVLQLIQPSRITGHFGAQQKRWVCEVWFWLRRTSNQGARFAKFPELRWISSQCHNWWQRDQFLGRWSWHWPLVCTWRLALSGSGGCNLKTRQSEIGWHGMIWGMRMLTGPLIMFSKIIGHFW